MMTISNPAPSASTTPAGISRIVLAYVLTLISVAVGGIAFIVGLVGAQGCDREGFACLGWLVYGALAWAAVAVVLFVVLALKRRLGLPFVAITVAVVVLAVMIPGMEPIRVLVGVLAPGLAAWLTGPRGRWWPRIAVLAAVLLLLPIGFVSAQVRVVDYRESLYVREGVAPVGLSDDHGWDYASTMESVTGRGFSYQMSDSEGRRVRVEITHAEDTPLAPPRNCSLDPHRTIACEQRADRVFRSPNEARAHRIVVVGQSIVEVKVTSEQTFEDAEFDQLAQRLEEQSPRWLAERDCDLCRFLP